MCISFTNNVSLAKLIVSKQLYIKEYGYCHENIEHFFSLNKQKWNRDSKCSQIHMINFDKSNVKNSSFKIVPVN